MRKRDFLKSLFMAPVAAKTAGEAAVKQAMTEAGMGVSSIGSLTPALRVMNTWESYAASQSSIAGRLFAFIKKNGMPKWKRNRVRTEADKRMSAGVDPDLAALKSVSFAYKAMVQRKRNFDRVFNDEINMQVYRKAMNKYYKDLEDYYEGY